MTSPEIFADPDALAEAVIARVGRRVVLGLPLGLGKATHLANALYRRAERDPRVSLSIFTALTLEAPRYGSDLERRFLAPVVERLMGGYPVLAYAEAQRRAALPPNVEVNEFFFQAGTRLGAPAAQQAYIAANYTHALRLLLERGVNVVGQLVARRDAGDGARYSLSCNTDITLDLLRARGQGRADFLLVGQVSSELPFMPGPGELAPDAFAYVLQGPAVDHPLFAPPNEPVEAAHAAQGLHVAALVPDGGTLQLGIGATSDAVVAALLLRQQDNRVFRETVARLGGPPPPEGAAHLDPFGAGLYAATEMFVDGFLHLYRAGILKREVDGAVLHGGFFLGPRAFYAALREMDPADLARLQMTAVSFTNELYGEDEAARRRARVGARFVNAAMMATLTGAVVSDGLEDGRVVSGVGGQFNFVDQAFALEDAHSVITLNAARTAGGRAQSNLRWTYGHVTVPRHLKDVIVTEYGAAHLRGRTDRDTVAAMLAIADSRFQPELLEAARAAGKIESGYEIPAAFRDNTPDRIERALQPARDAGRLPLFPLGTDFDAVELRLLPALGRLRAAQGRTPALLALLRRGLAARPAADDRAALARMGLERPRGIKDRLYAALLLGALG